MKTVLAAFGALTLFMPAAMAEECRRVIEPTVIAVVAHGDVWVRRAERGLTFRAESCKTNIGGNLYCRVQPYRSPEVFLKHADKSGREYTAFWGDSCK